MPDTPKSRPREDLSFDPGKHKPDNELEKKGELTFLQHLDVLRWHIIRAVIAVLVFTIAAFYFKGLVIDTILLGPTSPAFPTYQTLCEIGTFLSEKTSLINAEALCFNDLPPQEDLLRFRKVAEPFTLHMTISFVAGFIMAFPYVFWEFWRFIKPALETGEKKAIRGTVLIVSLLFFTGVAFGYFILTPLGYNFFATYELTKVAKFLPDFSSYIALITNMVLLSGLMFQLPVVMYYLTKIGLVTP
jgi:sec-independent protein translocase protein TatC